MTVLSPWRPPYDFKAARPTFVDAWPQRWLELTPAHELVQLSPDEMGALGRQIAGFSHWFPPVKTSPLSGLARRLDTVIQRKKRSCFIRLTSRSPKDSLYAQRMGLCVKDGGQALALIVDGSERCAADLRMAMDDNVQMSVVVRQWIDFHACDEFRCFMVNREFVGASQYECPGITLPSWSMHQAESVVRALVAAMNSIVATTYVVNGAFDIVCLPNVTGLNTDVYATLLDVNPLTKVTDLGLFSSSLDFDRTVRFRSAEAHTSVSLPVDTSAGYP